MALADLHDLIYFHDKDDLYVNLFVPSTVVWDRQGSPITIRQSTRFPESESTELIITAQHPATFGLKVRVPGWRAGSLEFSVNGERVTDSVDGHGWAVVRRQWKAGDHVSIRLPMKFDVRPLDTARAISGNDHARTGGAGRPLLRAKPRGLTARARSDESTCILRGRAADLSCRFGRRYFPRPAVLCVQARRALFPLSRPQSVLVQVGSFHGRRLARVGSISV